MKVSKMKMGIETILIPRRKRECIEGVEDED